MLATLLGISILIKLLQPENAYSPILTTLFDIFILVKLLQPENAESSIFVHPSSSITSFRLLGT